MPSQIYNTMKSYLEHFYNNTCYTLSELTSSGRLFTTHFNDYDEAKDYGKSTSYYDSTVYIYKTKCVKVYDSVNDIESKQVKDEWPNDANADAHSDVDYDPKFDFSNMTIKPYGKGYLLKPPKDSDYYAINIFTVDGGLVLKMAGFLKHLNISGWLIMEHTMKSVILLNLIFQTLLFKLMERVSS